MIAAVLALTSAAGSLYLHLYDFHLNNTYILYILAANILTYVYLNSPVYLLSGSRFLQDQKGESARDHTAHVVLSSRYAVFFQSLCDPADQRLWF